MNTCYITRRIIDACLRENVFGLLDKVSVTETAPKTFEKYDCDWLKIQFDTQIILLPVHSTCYMQSWRTASDFWLEQQTSGKWSKSTGYVQWLRLLALNEDEDTRSALSNYCLEADTAVRHRKLCMQAYNEQRVQLQRIVSDIDGWQHRLLFSEQVAAFQDHPYYPTARAKFGFDDKALHAYAPEFTPSFKLRWLAIEKKIVTQTSPVPLCWPSFSDVGLASNLTSSHELFPVHPLTWDALDNLPQGIIKASQSALRVKPTLSVRTLLVESAPEIHIKLPITMRTLGNKNVRLIKPSTLYDGHLFSRLLMLIEQQDTFLQGKYQHCNELHGAHVGDDKQLAYIVREYPQFVCNNETRSLVPVAALASEMPDGRLYLQHLIDVFYGGNIDAWLSNYIELMVGVHLRLWLKYGIALEANQQNAVLVFERNEYLTLLMKDNDSARLWPERFRSAMPELTQTIANFIDKRILVDSELPLAQMFTTIIIQLNITAIFEALSEKSVMPRETLYRSLRHVITQTLKELKAQGVEVDFAKKVLLENEFLYVKYLLSAGSLMTKNRSGAEDINKFYGLSAANFLREE